jgi:D-alanyl-D-alanine carboxypeptidase
MSPAYRKPDTCRQHHASQTGGMTYSKPARTTTRRLPSVLISGLLVVIAAIAAGLGYQSLASSSSTAASPIDVLSSEHRGLPGEHRGPLGEADGAVPDGVTVFDDEIPGVANLDPALLGVLRQAATDAADDGVEFFVDSGWRSPEYQERLLLDAISKYGSEREAARWVATPTTSPHVSGDAVDIGPSDATAWLSERGAEYGLCQIYGNEPWHYEVRPEAVAHGCPPMYADPTHDPSMQQWR